MTEEQKEYEAMQLVNLMDRYCNYLSTKFIMCDDMMDVDRMQRSGLISPARVGEDGRPEAVEHVLQLIENTGGHTGSGEEED